MPKKLVVSFITVVALAAVFSWAASFWYVHYGMSPEEQYMKLYKTDPLKQKLLKTLGRNATDRASLDKYIEVLVMQGDLGRADLISRVYGISSPQLESVQKLFQSLLDDSKDSTIENRKHNDEWIQLSPWPVYGAFRFCQGYRFAVLGDWQSARNEMLAIRNPKSGIVCPPLLKDQVDYLLARAYQELGKPKDALKLIKPLVDSNKENGLRPKVYAAIIESSLATGDTATAESYKKKLSYVNGFTWEKAKVEIVFGRHYLEQKKPTDALKSFITAIAEDDSDGSRTKEAVLGAIDAFKMNDLSLLIAPGGFKILAVSATKRGLASELLAEYKSLKAQGVGAAMKNELVLSILILELELGNLESAKSDLAALNLAGAPDDIIADALFYLAEYERKRGELDKADFHYGESAALSAPISAEARWQSYLLMKANKTKNTYNTQNAAKSLEFIVDHYPNSDRFVDAIEELLPIYFFESKYDVILSILPKLENRGRRAEVLMYYWIYRVAERKNDSKKMSEALSKLAWKSFTYYELLTADAPAQSSTEFLPILDQPERTDEIFFGMGLTDLGRESAINAEWIFPDISLAEEVFARENYGTFESSAWFAEKLLEKGIISTPELNRELLDIACPLPFSDEVHASAARHRVPPALVWAVMKKESSFKPDAVSSAGARGLMQIMPDTAEWLLGGGKANPAGDWRTDPASNIELGCAYLEHLMYDRVANYPEEVVISAYNAGPGNAKSWAGRYAGIPGWLYVELIPNIENEVFTKKVLKYALVYSKIEGEK